MHSEPQLTAKMPITSILHERLEKTISEGFDCMQSISAKINCLHNEDEVSPVKEDQAERGVQCFTDALAKELDRLDKLIAYMNDTRTRLNQII